MRVCVALRSLALSTLTTTYEGKNSAGESDRERKPGRVPSEAGGVRGSEIVHSLVLDVHARNPPGRARDVQPAISCRYISKAWSMSA